TRETAGKARLRSIPARRPQSPPPGKRWGLARAGAGRRAAESPAPAPLAAAGSPPPAAVAAILGLTPSSPCPGVVEHQFLLALRSGLGSGHASACPAGIRAGVWSPCIPSIPRAPRAETSL